MSSEENRARDDLIQRYLLDGPEALSASERDELAAGEHAQEAAELEAIMEQLAESGHERREASLQEVASEEPLLAARQIRAAFDARPARQRSWRSLALAAAVAAAVLIYFWPRSATDDRDETPLLLGDGVPALVAPVGDVESFDEFRWEHDADFAGTFTLEIVGTSPTAAASELRFEALEDTRWIPTPEQRTALPRSIRWRVIAVDDFSNRRAASDWVSSSSR